MDHECPDGPPGNTGNAEALRRGKKFWAKLLEEGKAVEKFKAVYFDNYAKALGYAIKWQGHNCFAVNVGMVSSDVFGSRIEEYDILLPHIHNGRQWTVSLYSQNVDVSEIAKSFGGGGHKGAAGFQCDVLPWMEPKCLSPTQPER